MPLEQKTILARLQRMQDEIRSALVEHMRTQAVDRLSNVARDDDGDTIFGIDVAVEELILRQCEAWGASQHFTLIAEGLPASGIEFGRSGLGGPPFRLLADPIDGTRGLMFDKRSAWCLMGCAPDRGEATCLSDIDVAVMTELPTTRQHISDVLWAVRDDDGNVTTAGERHDLVRGSRVALSIQPSTAADIRHGFASVANYFPGGKALLAELDEAIITRAMGGWNPDKAEVYSDQYISTGGQLAELVLGRDRFVLDCRPLVHRKLGFGSTLACRPYDLATWLVAAGAGCTLATPAGEALDAPLDLVTNVAFAAYANDALRDLLQPIVREEVHRLLG